MGWTYKHQKMRDTLRKAYTEATGSDDYRSLAFLEWVNAREGL